MSEIDWANAPEWADKYGVAGPDSWRCWYSDKQYAYISDPKEVFIFSNFDTFSRHIKDFTMVEARPSPAWSGEGLPPVGVDLQWFSSVYGWIGGKVVAHDDQTTIVRHNDGYEGCYLHNLKPCKTPEQIAADEREAAIDEMNDFSTMLDMTWSRKVCAALYDAGYRKQADK